MNSIYVIDRDTFSRDCKMYAELQCLQLRAISQLLPTDASRKSQVIFYFRTCTRLSSRCYSFYDRRREAFRGCIDRSRESCRTCSDDGNVVDHPGVRSLRNAQFVCQVGDGRARQDPPIREYDCRQPSGIFISVFWRYVYDSVRIVVADEETLKMHHPVVTGFAFQNHSA